MAGGGVLTVSKANAYVDELVRKLENEFQTQYSFNVSDVITAGSLGHGTAIPGNFDLDLVLYSRDIDCQVVIKKGVGNILLKLNDYLSRAYGGNYHYISKTPYALQFKLYDTLEVDLLPSPYWRSADTFQRFLARYNPDDRRKLQSSEAKWEKLFFQQQPNEVKEYIKRAKAWRNKKWPSSQTVDGRPKSFLLGLLVVEAFRKSDRKDSASVTTEMKQLVKNHHSLRLHWSGAGAFHDESILCQYKVPYIIDPANPFNNVYYSGISQHRANNKEDTYGPGDGNWTVFVRYIDSLDLSVSI